MTAPMIPVHAIHHYALSVKDLDATADWYAQMFGFKRERAFGFPEAGVKIMHLVHPAGIRLELLHATTSRPSADLGTDAFTAIANRGSKHLGLQVKGIEAIAASLKARGVPFLHELSTVEIAGVRNFWILDNEGNQVEIVEPLP